MRRRYALWICLTLTLCASGCMSMAGLLMYVKNGLPKFPAEYDGLKEKRVAVVCVSAANSYGPDNACNRITREVRALLAANVDDIDVVHENEVSDVLDRNDWSRINPFDVGKGVKADMVVSIELNEPLKLREGPTLFRGKADFTVTVLDIKKGGEKVFRRRHEEFRWPSQARYGLTDNKFEQAFTKRVGARIAQHFYPVEEHSEIGENTNDINEF